MNDLTFLMGKRPAILPGDRRYCRNHMWCHTQPDGSHRFGFTTYAIQLMKDVFFLDWCVDVGQALTSKQQIGNIESSKATSDLFAPIAGRLTAINQEALKDPALINTSGYADGWLFAMSGDISATMDVQQYYDYLVPTWENTQRILKAQIGKLDDED